VPLQWIGHTAYAKDDVATMAGAYSRWLRLRLVGREGNEAEEGGEEKTENGLRGAAGSSERDQRVLF